MHTAPAEQADENDQEDKEDDSCTCPGPTIIIGGTDIDERLASGLLLAAVTATGESEPRESEDEQDEDDQEDSPHSLFF